MATTPAPTTTGASPPAPDNGSAPAPVEGAPAMATLADNVDVAPPPAHAKARPRRTVRVADMDVVTNELKRLSKRCDELEWGMEKSKAVVASARLSLNGIRALQQAAQQEAFPLGRSLQRRLSTRLIERLKVPPPSGLNRSRDGASQRENRAKVLLKLDADADRRSMDELVDMLSLSYTLPGPSKRDKASRLIEFSTPSHLIDALGLSANLRLWAMAQSFTRTADGSTPVRVVAERFDDDNGTTWFILERRENGVVYVASRQTEEFDPQRRRFAHALELKTVSSIELPGLPDSCPAYLRWRPSTAAALMGFEEGLVSERVSLSLPCCVVELGCDEVLRVLREEQARQQA